MKKIIAALLIIVSLVCMAGCSTSMYSSLMLKESGNNINRWEVSWQKMNGTLTKELFPTENNVLNYTMEGNLEDVTVTVSQGETSVTLSASENSLKLDNFKTEPILITVVAKNADKVKLTFNLAVSE